MYFIKPNNYSNMAKNPQINHRWHDSESTGKDFLFQMYDRIEIKCNQPIQVITTFRGLSVSTKSSPLRTGGEIYQPFVKTKKLYIVQIASSFSPKSMEGTQKCILTTHQRTKANFWKGSLFNRRSISNKRKREGERLFTQWWSFNNKMKKQKFTGAK